VGFVLDRARAAGLDASLSTLPPALKAYEIARGGNVL